MLGTQIKIFAIDLVKERLDTAECDFTEALQDGELKEVPLLMAQVFTVASLLTCLFHQLKLLTGAAPRRSGYDDSTSIDDSLTDWVLLEQQFVVPSLEILDDINKETALEKIANQLTEKYLPAAGNDLKDFSSRIMERLKERVKRTSKSLQPAKDPLYWSDVEWWAELAWLMIVAFTMRAEQQIASYPGWADLLLELSCFGDVEDRIYPSIVSRDDKIYPSIVGRPVIANLFEGKALIKSKWNSDTLSKLLGDARPEFKVYDEVAKMLIAQTSFREPYHKKAGDEPPVPSAFVTSFDLELEIALLRQLKGGQKILIAFPVYLSNGKNSVVHTCWLVLEVKRVNDLSKENDRKKQLTLLTQPKLKNFSTLSHLSLKEMNCPIVVRLAGCPLIELPKVSDKNELSGQLKTLFSSAFFSDVENIPKVGTRDDEIEAIHNSLQLHHAIIVSEHSATIHNVIDLLHTGAASATHTAGAAGKTSGQLNPGLSSDVAVSERNWVRFWLLLGVQVKESAIRKRVGTLLSVLPRGVGTPPRNAETHYLNDEIRGVAINRRINALENDFLAWNGLVAVNNSTDDCFQLIEKQIKNISKPAEKGY